MSGLKVNYKLYWVVITMLMQYVTITLLKNNVTNAHKLWLSNESSVRLY